MSLKRNYGFIIRFISGRPGDIAVPKKSQRFAGAPKTPDNLQLIEGEMSSLMPDA